MSQEQSDTVRLLDEVRRVGELSESAFAKIVSLSADVTSLKQQLTSVSSGSKLITQRLRVFFGTSHLERKPFTISMSGALEGSINVSPVRAAIFLVGFVDLQDRSEGGRGVANFVTAVVRVLRRLENRSTPEGLLAESVRVALYRFEQYLYSAPEFRNKSGRLAYSQQRERLRFSPEDVTPQLDVSSDNPIFAELIDELFTTSPLERLRRVKAMYVPPGPRGLEKILLEMYEHEFPLKVRSIYLRPASLNCPRDLLLSWGASPSVMRRHELALEGMASGKIHFLEILREESLRDLCKVDAAGKSIYYPFNPEPRQIVSHFDHLIWRATNLPGFELVITKSELPTYLVTYEIARGERSEHFALCCRRVPEVSAGSDLLADLAVYFINDQVVSELLSGYTIDWVLRHPTTVVERKRVIEILVQIRDEFCARSLQF